MKWNTTNLIESSLCKRRYPDDSLWNLGNLKNNRKGKRQFAFSGILISPVLPCPPISSLAALLPSLRLAPCFSAYLHALKC